MKITIDSDVCLREGLTIDDALMLITLKFNQNFEKSLSNLTSAGFITRYGVPVGPISITQEGLNKIQDIICDSTEGTPKKRDLDKLAGELQELFPQGKTNGYYWRGARKEIVTKLQRFLTIYGKKWTDEQIIAATRHYVDENLGNPYMRLLKYFILKDGSSDLAEVLENMNSENSVVSDFRTTLI